MPYEQRDNSGSLWPNDRKREGKQDADFTGSVMIGGKHYWINAWTKQAQRGEYFSLAFKPKTASTNSPQVIEKCSKPAAQRTPQDDVPF